MHTISKSFHFEAAHQLPRVPEGHKCARLHGHSYQVTIFLRGEADPQTGMLVDFGDISKVWESFHARLDHRFLNEIEGLENPTSENFARWLFERLRPYFEALWAVEVRETASSCARYQEEV